MSGCSRSALIQTEAGLHSPVGQRHLLAPRLESDPAKRHSPCSHVGGLWSPRSTAGVLRSGMTALGDEPLAVRVGGHVRAVDGDVSAKFGKLLAEGGGTPPDARPAIAAEAVEPLLDVGE